MSKILQYIFEEVEEIKRINEEKIIKSTFESIVVPALKNIEEAKKVIYELREDISNRLDQIYDKEKQYNFYLDRLVDEHI